jgi:hypothetical protein
VSAREGAEEPPYHLVLDGEETALTARALRLLISDEAHEPLIRRIAREVLAELDAALPGGRLTLTLNPGQMKITHSAVQLMLKDLRRDQPRELELLRAVLDKLPDEHVMRAIQLG